MSAGRCLEGNDRPVIYKSGNKPPKPAVPSKCKSNASQHLWMCCSPDALQQPLWKAVSQRGWGSRRHPNRPTLPPTPSPLVKSKSATGSCGNASTHLEPSRDRQLTQPHACPREGGTPATKNPPLEGPRSSSLSCRHGHCLLACSLQSHSKPVSPTGQEPCIPECLGSSCA